MRSTPGRVDDRPTFRSHYIPRTARGRLGVGLFLSILALAEPPIVHRLANSIEPWVFGFPFLYAYLLVVCGALIATLIWAWRRDR